MDEVNSDLTRQIETNCMLFMGETKLRVNMQVIKFDLNLTWQAKANCVSFISWNRIESEHASNQIWFQTNQANWS